MIALDLDGTLALDNHQVSPATRDALQELHEDGVEVVIATGRRYRTTRFVIDNLGLEVFAVCNGGSLVKRPDQRTLHSAAFSVKPVVELARQMNLTVFAQRDPHDHGGADFIIDTGTSWNADTHLHHNRNQEWSEKGDLLESDEEYLVCGIMATEPELRALADALESHTPDQKAIVVPHTMSNEHYCEISPRHVDKWHGLSALNDHFELTADNVCAVGDQLNDMAMIEKAGHGVAMANGHEDLQQIASFVCGHNEEDGLLDVVNYIREYNASR
jgi:Cof subfamily protein (haloacid dehalogenase superfamily)